jgi:voltage-gated potassium channel
MTFKDERSEKPLEQARTETLQQLEDWLETPLLVLGLVWLALLVKELVEGLSPLLERLSLVIWAVFLVDFGVKFLLAPHKLAYLKTNWLTVIALLVPALRVFRLAQVVRLLRVARAARGVRLVRILTSLNRGMKALNASMGRRGFGYVLALTTLVTFAGAAGMFAFESDAPQGFDSYGEALWWTAMLLTSIASEYWPQTAEGRLLCFLLSLYGFAVFGYVTASLATFFIGREAEAEDTELAGARSLQELRAEIAALRAEIQGLRPEPRGRSGQYAP